MTSTDAVGRRDALVERLFSATIGTLELFGVYLGVLVWGALFLRDQRLRTLFPVAAPG